MSDLHTENGRIDLLSEIRPEFAELLALSETPSTTEEDFLIALDSLFSAIQDALDCPCRLIWRDCKYCGGLYCPDHPHHHNCLTDRS